MKGTDVERIRKRLGMTRQQLADALGTTFQTVWRWEHGVHPVSRPYQRLLKILLDKRLDAA